MTNLTAIPTADLLGELFRRAVHDPRPDPARPADFPARPDPRTSAPASPFCVHCGGPIRENEVLVYADSTGREGAATDTYHLEHYLDCADLGLPSNAALRPWARLYVRQRIVDALGGDD